MCSGRLRGACKRGGAVRELTQASRSIGERLSPYVGAGCFLMGVSVLCY